MSFATILAIILDVAIAAIGFRFLLLPGAAAEGYGVPVRNPEQAAYLSVKANRDITTGLVGLALLAFVGTRAEAWFMLVVSIEPLSDTLIVLNHGGPKWVAYGIHLTTAAACLLDAALLFRQ